jgi:hypothetical protein
MDHGVEEIDHQADEDRQKKISCHLMSLPSGTIASGILNPTSFTAEK